MLLPNDVMMQVPCVQVCQTVCKKYIHVYLKIVIRHLGYFVAKWDEA